MSSFPCIVTHLAIKLLYYSDFKASLENHALIGRKAYKEGRLSGKQGPKPPQETDTHKFLPWLRNTSVRKKVDTPLKDVDADALWS